jgi:flagellar biosynthetic protein FliR
MSFPIPDPTVFLLVLARVGGLIGASPIFGHLIVPVRVRVGLTLVLAVAVGGALGTPPGPLPTTLLGLTGALAVEATLGAVIGLVAQFVFAGVLLGGQLAGIQMGFGIANLIDPQSHAQVTIVAQWQQLMAFLVFLVLDVHHLLIGALLASFHTTPPGSVVLSAVGLRGTISLAGELFTLGVRIAAPVLVALLLANTALGILARTIPQLNVFVVGFPVNVGVGLLMLGASLPFTFRLLTARFGALEPTLDSLVRGFAHG